MKKIYLFAIFALLAGAFTVNAEGARWEQVLQMQGCYQVFATSHGTILASDMRDDNKSGISYSEDYGATWTKCEDIASLDYAYFFEYEDYVFALGKGCIVLRSSDWGRTWEEFDYLDAADQVVKEGFLITNTKPDDSYAYGGLGFDGKIYVANMNIGIFVSEDFGETWTPSDPEGLSYGSVKTPAIYTLVEYNDKIYAFGQFTMFELLIVELELDGVLQHAEAWRPLNNRSNFLTQVTVLDDVMVGGRGVNNATYDVPFILTSKNGVDWEGVSGRPMVWDKFEESYVPLKQNYVSAIGTYHSPVTMGSYLIVMTQVYGVFSSTDMGKTWADFSDGLPLNIQDPVFPVGPYLAKDDKYMYAAIFSIEGDSRSGVYRFPLSEIPATELGIEAPIVSDVLSVEYFDMSGRKVVNPTPGSLLIKKENTANGVKASKIISK